MRFHLNRDFFSNVRTLVIVAIAFGSTNQAAFAQYFADPAQLVGNGKTGFEGYFASSKIDFELEHDSVETRRTILGGNMSFGYAPKFDLFAGFGFIAKSEILYDFGDIDDGKGFVMSGGGRFQIGESGRATFFADGAIAYSSESYHSAGGVNATIDATLFELTGGGSALFAATPTIGIYGGLLLVPLSDGDVKVKIKSRNSQSDDYNRSDLLSLRIGAHFKTGTAYIRPELTLMSETTFVIAAGTNI